MNKVLLMILDGLGLSENKNNNAVYLAQTPNLDKLMKNYPNTRLKASGLEVGLPQGQIGNSEVGHLNIGAGRVVFQELTRINREIENGGFFQNQALNNIIDGAKDKGKNLHLIGLVSKGGVHSSFDHLLALLELCKKKDFDQVFIHCFLDGRDVLPNSGYEDIKELREIIKDKKIGQISTIVGRYYAMDRDNRWERIKIAYDAMVKGIGQKRDDYLNAIKDSYEDGITDEFVKPIITSAKRIEKGDSIIFFNFRADRARQMTKALTDPDFKDFDHEDLDLDFLSMTEYDNDFENVEVAYEPIRMENTLGEYLAKKGLKQLRIAETEKYAHVTFFFNGGEEEPNEKEDRILINSPKVATYDLKPEMSAYEITDRLTSILDDKYYDFIVVNFANPDMVGHTGIMEAAIKAVETVDECMGRVLDKARESGYKILITADHGNVEQMTEEDDESSVHTAHTTNDVPLILVGQEADLDEGKLSNIAPTILDIMGIEKAEEMTENTLIRR